MAEFNDMEIDLSTHDDTGLADFLEKSDKDAEDLLALSPSPSSQSSSQTPTSPAVSPSHLLTLPDLSMDLTPTPSSPTQPHTTPPPTIIQAPPTPSTNSPTTMSISTTTTHSTTTITTPTTTHSTTTTFHKLVELNHHKTQHTRQLTILHKHITNHTTPTGLTITLQPWVELSQKHKEAWDTSLRDCMNQLTNILHQHHTEQLERVEEQISSLATTINNNHATDVSTTIMNIAATTTYKRPRPKHKSRSKSSKKPSIKPSTTPSTKPSTTPSTTPSITTPTKTTQHHQGFRTGPHRPNLRPHHRQHNPPPPTPPPPMSNVTRADICQRLVGKQAEFPIIYNMFMKEGQ